VQIVCRQVRNLVAIWLPGARQEPTGNHDRRGHRGNRLERGAPFDLVIHADLLPSRKTEHRGGRRNQLENPTQLQSYAVFVSGNTRSTTECARGAHGTTLTARFCPRING
jgi:hypothetical protein